QSLTIPSLPQHIVINQPHDERNREHTDEQASITKEPAETDDGHKHAGSIMQSRKEEPESRDCHPIREDHDKETFPSGEAQQRERKQVYLPQKGSYMIRLLHSYSTSHKTWSFCQG